MTQHNVGALVVVKPGEQHAVAGIITERGMISHKFKFLKPSLSNHKVQLMNELHLKR